MPRSKPIPIREIAEADLNHAVRIGPHTWWVGHYRPGDPFQCNVYLIEAGDQSVLFDPGSVLTYEVTRRKIEEVLPFDNIRYFVCHHQDPDIVAALPTIDAEVRRPDAVIVTHWRAHMLLQHYGLRLPFWRVEENGWRLQVGKHALRFIFTPYMHFPGAFATFDESTGILFSSDIFGGVSDDWSLVARDEGYFEAVRAFHEHYMPSRDIVRSGLARFDKLPINLIAPQHGSLVPRRLVPFLMNEVKSLECGIYLLAHEDTDIRRLLDLNQALRDLTHALVVYRDFSIMANDMVRIAGRFLPVDGVEFYAASEPGRAIHFAPETNYRGIPMETPEWVEALIERTTRTRVRHIRADQAGNSGICLAIPLQLGKGEPPNSIALLSLSAEAAPEAVDQLVDNIAAPLAISLEREVIHRTIDLERQALYERSIRDPLTCLYTRFYMQDALARQISIHNRDDAAGIVLLMCDVDFFKQVNDTYGHSAGDEVLRRVAEVLIAHTRASDLAVRLGGEEFAVFLIGPGESNAAQTAERIRETVAELAFVDDLVELHVTISIGLAHHRRAESLGSLIARADVELYRSKREGRNRLCIAEDSPC